MIICNNVDDEVPIIQLYDVIGEVKDKEGNIIGGISGTEFANFLSVIDKLGKKRIDVYINSLGGSIVEGMTIYSAIKSAKTPVNTVCTGIAVSMAGVILQAGKKRQMVPWGQLMTHPPSGGDEKELSALKDTLVKMLIVKSGMSAEEMTKLMDETSWINAEDCLELRLIDEIMDIETEVELPVITKETEPQAAFLALKNVVNQLKTKDTMKNVIAFLNLNDSASEADVIKSITALQNKGTAFGLAVKQANKTAINALNSDEDEDEDADKLKDKMEKVCKALKDKEEECENLKNELKNLKNVAVNKEATEYVNKAVEAGKFKAEVSKDWVDMYVANPEATKKLVDAMNGNKMGARMETQVKTGDGNKRGEIVNLAPGEKATDLAEFMAQKKKDLKF